MGNVQRVLIMTDAHLRHDEEPHQSYRLVKRFAKDWRPDIVVDLGDWLDLNYLSSFDKEKLRHLESRRLRGDYDLAHRELDYWQGITPRLIKLEGNHDERIERWIDAVPALEGVIDYDVEFDFAGRGIAWHRYRDGQPIKLGKLNMMHGYYHGKYPVAKTLDVYMGNVVFGDVHRFQTFSRGVPNYADEIQAWSIGCLCGLQPEYAKGRPMGWQNGFAVMYLHDSGNFNLYPINIIEDTFTFEGRVWE